MGNRWILLICILFPLLSCTQIRHTPSKPTIVKDNFNDGIIDNTIWTSQTMGIGPFVAEKNGQLEITIPASSIPDRAGITFGGGYAFNLANNPINGDFDASVSFRLHAWSIGNGVRIGFSTSKGGVERISFSAQQQQEFGMPAEQYVADFSPSGFSPKYLVASDTSGALRFTRTNTASANPTLTAYMMDSHGQWVPIALVTGTRARGEFEYFSLSAWSHSLGQFGYMDTKVTFDNFSLTIYR